MAYIHEPTLTLSVFIWHIRLVIMRLAGNIDTTLLRAALPSPAVSLTPVYMNTECTLAIAYCTLSPDNPFQDNWIVCPVALATARNWYHPNVGRSNEAFRDTSPLAA